MQSGSNKLDSAELADVFMYCFVTEVDRVTQTDSADAVAVISQWTNLVESIKLPYMFSSDQWARITAKTFAESEGLAEFVMALTISIQFTLSRKNQDIAALCDELADSMMLLDKSDKIHADWDITSKVYSDRFQGLEETKSILAKNRWTLPLVLGALYLPETIRLVESQSEKPRNKRQSPTTNSQVV